MSLLKFRKQTQEKWSELIHDGPRMDTSPVGMIMTYQRRQYALPDDIAILAGVIWGGYLVLGGLRFFSPN